MLYWLVIAPILAGIIIYALPFRRVGKAAAILAHAAAAVCAFLVFLETRTWHMTEPLGGFFDRMGITLKADALSAVFLLLTSFIFLVVAVYNQKEKLSPLFRFLMLAWQGLLNGVFLTTDLFNVFVLIEVATVAVSVLIMYNRDNRSTRDGMIYLMANTVAVQFYLFGIGYIYKLTGTLDMAFASELLEISRGFKDSAVYRAEILPFALIMTFVCLKCALMPLFSWLPKAHGTPGAPTGVSAILSGLHIKSGLYLFIRFQDFFKTIDLSEFFLIAGIITGILGFVFAVSQKDIKLVLAYHTISQIGMIMIGLNGGDIYSRTGGVYHIVSHAVFKAALFLCAGIIMKAYKTRDISKIRGVLRQMPVVGATMIMAVFGITGAPFFNGSISKYFIMSGADWLVNSAVMLINLGTIISFIKYSNMLFGKTETAAKIDGFKQAAVLSLGVLCLAGGIFGEWAVKQLFGVELQVNLTEYVQKIGVFALSVIAGWLIYRFYIRKSAFLSRIREFELSFRGICVSMGLFFAATLIVAQLAA